MKTVLITGGTGLVGKQLTQKLLKKGYNVSVLSRTAKQDHTVNYFTWNIYDKTIDKQAILTSDYIIHLAGAGVADKRWTKSRKKLIIDSRVESSKLILDVIKKENHKLKAFISASGTNCYGTITSKKIFTEQDNLAQDFLGKVCQLWEQAADNFKSINTRVVKLRTGIVLSANGGAFDKISKPIKLGFGSIVGSGKQYMPWIHIDDLCSMYIYAIENNNLFGSYNAVAPEHINNSNFTKFIAQKVKKSIWLPKTPSFILKIILGEMAEIILKGSRISSQKILQTGFKFKHTTFSSALDNLVSKQL